MRKNNNIFILGRENVNWSIDKDRQNIQKFLADAGNQVTDNIFKSDIIFCVWWNVAFKYRLLLKMLRKKLIVTVTNDVNNKIIMVRKIRGIVDCWICANETQKRQLIENSIDETKIVVLPYYVNEKVFKKRDVDKKNISEKLNIDYSLIEGRFLIGSFQRDSQNSDLLKPRWQKNPDLLVEILKDIDKNSYCLILAGPGRHYLINRCRSYGIPYIFVGNERCIDDLENDLLINNLDEHIISMLYNMIDLYIVTSKSEGGPKAVIETSLSETMIISTPVGLANDLLSPNCIFTDSIDARKKIIEMITGKIKVGITVQENFEKALRSNNYGSHKQTIELIIDKMK